MRECIRASPIGRFQVELIIWPDSLSGGMRERIGVGCERLTTAGADQFGGWRSGVVRGAHCADANGRAPAELIIRETGSLDGARSRWPTE